MSFGEDEEILQDFLVEAGEILDQLSEQLVDLEQRPDDQDLLNAIFRGFHTVKGGAGFLQLDAMVECCHVTENLFDILRNGKRTVTSELMDVVLQSLDTVNSQFQQISQRETPTPASQHLLDQLARLVSCEDLNDTPAPAAEAPAEASVAPPVEAPTANQAASEASSAKVDFTDAEFEGFLDAIDEGAKAPAARDNQGSSASAASLEEDTSDSDEISEDEFEALLDQLHGSGKGPGAQSPKPAAAADGPEPFEDTTPTAAAPASGNEDEITEAEFESLLDQLHGSGKGPGAKTEAPAASSPAPAPAPKATSADPSAGQTEQASSAASNSAAPPPAAANTSSANSGSTNSDAAANNSSSSAAKAGGGDLITDDEFENLLDQLHGAGKGPGKEAAASAPAAPKPAAAPASPAASPAASSSSAPKPREAKPAAAAPKAREAAAGGGNPAQNGETTVRVDTQRLDDIMNMVGELVLVRNRLVRLGLDSSDESLSKAVANLDVVTGDLQTAVMKTRMQPIKKVFGRFPRVVRDLARNLKKEINLELVGEDTDLDKNLVEALADPLVHLVRNSVDHGIELPAAREEKGKSRVGKVVLAAEQEGDHILLSIADDGAGMDPDKLREKAVEKGLYDSDAAARLSDVEAYNLIFAPGFSTKTEISDVSGRGVGMDVVKTKITQLNGSIEIQSKRGEGTRFAIKVPLTLAIMPTLMVMLGRQCFALPLVSVNEIFQMDLSKAHVVDGQECVTIREKAIPIFHLKRWLVKRFEESESLEAHVVIVSVGTRRVGFVVDQLIGQEEVVIKPLGKMLQGTPGMAGATITGDGTIALILDVPSLLKRYAGRI